MTDIPPELVARMVAMLRGLVRNGYLIDIATIRAIVAELPEPVDPLLEDAREICAVEMECCLSPRTAGQIRAGDHDNGAMMKAALAALRRGVEIGRGGE